MLWCKGLSFNANILNQCGYTRPKRGETADYNRSRNRDTGNAAKDRVRSLFTIL